MSDRKILAAWGERVSGPGWSNELVWVLSQDTAPGPEFGRLRIDAIQPEDQTRELRALLGASAELNGCMVRLVAEAMRAKEDGDG